MKNFQAKLQEQFNKMLQTGRLYISNISGREVWDFYLDSFKDGDDPMFRDPDSSTHNCNTCNNFVRRYGNIIAFDDNYQLMTLWDIKVDDEYQPSCDAITKRIKKFGIADIFVETYDMLKALSYETKLTNNQKQFNLGIAKNIKRYTKEEAEKFGVVKANETKTFHHLYLTIPSEFITINTNGRSIAQIKEEHRSNAQVLKRGLEEIPLDTLLLVQELIEQGSILNGDAHLVKVNEFIQIKKEYDKLNSVAKKNRFAWIAEEKLGMKSRFKNELIGVLCSDIATGVELNKACQDWNKRVDPANYMKAVAPFTEAQKKKAMKTVKEGGYEASFLRRLATMDDILADEIKHMNSGENKGISIFDNLKATKSSSNTSEKEIKGTEIKIDKFMSDILPKSTTIEAFLSNRHQNNMVTMTTSANNDGKPMFAWDNNYSWTYNGNLAGVSQIKQAVKSLGGKVDGVLRFSIMWAEDNIDNSDLDAHAHETPGEHIYFSNKASTITGGNLDIDVTQPQSHKRNSGKNVVENITYPSIEKLKGKSIAFKIRQFAERNSKGFKAEIEFNGEIFSYTYNTRVTGVVDIATVDIDKNGNFNIKHHIKPANTVSKEIYGLDSNQFHKVNLVCLSPNYWGKNKYGNKHFFFMLDECKAKDRIRTYHIENLNNELKAERKVLEPLASTLMIEPKGEQLSGLGFNATVRDEVVMRVTDANNVKKQYLVKF